MRNAWHLIIKRHIPAALAGLCCWILLSAVAGTSCWLRAIFGLPCPGCGSSRAVIALFHGNIKQAVEFHPLIFVSLILPVIFIIAFIFKINISKFRFTNIFLWCIIGLYISVFAVRMILFYPETEPLTYLDTSLWGRIINFIYNIYNTR